MRSVQTVVAHAAAVLALVVYALMWLGFRNRWGWLGWLDSSSSQAFYEVGGKHPLWVRFWDIVCTVFGPNAFRLLGAVAVVIVLAKRRLRVALFLVATVEFSGLITEIAKHLAHRPRPVTTLSNASSWSFPSGHALGVMVSVLALLMVLVPALSHSMHVVSVALGALIIGAVGFGRVALDAHHVSDVLAGWALGYVYFLLCFLVFRPLQRS
jgi:membrane-associated phospholipid phosphatase